MAARNISPTQLFFILDLFLPAGWETGNVTSQPDGGLMGPGEAEEILDRMCSAASRVARALVRGHFPQLLAEEISTSRLGAGGAAAIQVEVPMADWSTLPPSADFDMPAPMQEDDELCQICNRKYAAYELGGVECWSCFNEH